MTTPRQNQSRTASVACISRRGVTAEWTMAWLVLLAIAMSILSFAAGHAEFEGKEKNGVRRAASQLERKTAKGDLQQVARVRQTWIA